MVAGEAGEGRFLDASMAIEAANPEFAGVMLVAEGDRLVENDILAGHVRGMHITIGDANRQKWKKRPPIKTVRVITFARGRKICIEVPSRRFQGRESTH